MAGEVGERVGEVEEESRIAKKFKSHAVLGEVIH